MSSRSTSTFTQRQRSRSSWREGSVSSRNSRQAEHQAAANPRTIGFRARRVRERLLEVGAPGDGVVIVSLARRVFPARRGEQGCFSCPALVERPVLDGARRARGTPVG